MKRYSIFQAPVLAFGSPSLYRDVGRQWKGVAFGYLLLLLTICWIAPIIKLHTGFSKFLDNEAPKIVTQIPRITIDNGRASIDEPQPHRIIEPESGQVIAIIDTTGQITSLDQTDAKLLVTATEAIMEKNKFETQTFSFDEVDHFVLEQDMINGWLETARGLVAPIVYVLAVLGAYVFRILQALIYACIGLAFAAMCETKLNYASLIRLSVMSVTPGIIIETVLDTAGIHIPYGFLLYFIIAMGFLFFGVKACVQKHVPPVAIPVAPISPVAPVSPPPSPYAQPEM